MSSDSPASVLESSDGYELAAVNNTTIPVGTRGLLAEGSDGIKSHFIKTDGYGNQLSALTDGYNGIVAVKPANTSVKSTDSSLAVSISPNIGITGQLPVVLLNNSDIFGQVITSYRQPQIECQFFQQSPSNILNIITSGTSTATQGIGIAVFSTGTGTTSEIKGITLNTVSYSPHNEIYAAMTASFTTPTSASSYQRIGIYDGYNGFSFGYNGLTFGIWTRYNGVDTFIAQASWNTDTLSGAITSKFTNNSTATTLIQTNINLYRIRFGWLGISPIIFEVLSPDGNFVIVHFIRFPNSQTTASITNPNLPLTVDINKNAADATNLIISSGCWVAGSGVSGTVTSSNPGGNEINIHINSTITQNGSQIINFANFGNQQITLVINVTNAPTGISPTIQFYLQEVDPGNNLTVMGNLIISNVINGVGITTATLYSTVSTNVKVSWIVSGTTPSFTGVFTTLVSKSTSGNNFAGGETKVQLEGVELFLDNYSTGGVGSLDTVNLWNTPVAGGGGVAATVTNFTLVMGSGTTANGYSYLQSRPIFQTVSPGWLNIDLVISIEFPVATNSYRFWGIGTVPATPTAAAPLTDAIGFEIGIDGKLHAVTYTGGARNESQDLSISTGNGKQPTDFFPHTYTLFFRGNLTLWCIDNYNYVVAQIPNGILNPNNSILPVCMMSIAGPTAPTSSAVLSSYASFVGDTTHSSNALSDGFYGFRKATVKAASTAAVATDTSLVVAMSPNSVASVTTGDITATGALGALNATVQVSTSGLETAGFQLAVGTLIGTILPEVSFDNGTTWNSTYFDTTNGGKVATIVFASSNTATAATIIGVGGTGLSRVRISAYTSGTANITLRATTRTDPSVMFANPAGSVAPPDMAFIGGAVTTAAPTYTTATINALSLDTAGNLRVNASGAHIKATVQPLYGTNNQAMTITLASLASAAARASTSVSNTTNLFEDVLLFFKFQTAAGTISATGYVNVYGYGSVDGGTTYPEGITGTDAGVTLTSPPNLVLIAQINVNTANVSKTFGPISFCRMYGLDRLPAQWGVVVVNQTGLAFNATAGNLAVTYQGTNGQLT